MGLPNEPITSNSRDTRTRVHTRTQTHTHTYSLSRIILRHLVSVCVSRRYSVVPQEDSRETQEWLQRFVIK